MDQIYTLLDLLRGSREFDCPVYMCFVDLEKAYDGVPQGILCGVLQEYGVPGSLLQAIRFLYNQSRSRVCILGTRSHSFTVRV